MSTILSEHINYLSDARRTQLFREAIRATARAGDLVADVGCGTGILGLLCLEAGASKVWGIDATDIIEVARETMDRAGFGDRYVCIRGASHRVVLPERVDIIICDHVGFFGFDYDIVNTIQDARKRFLKPQGRIVPAKIRPMLAPIQSDPVWGKANAWSANEIPPEYYWVQNHAINVKYPVSLKPDELLGLPTPLGELDLAIDQSEFLDFETILTIDRQGTLHGIAGFFECELTPTILMTNSPTSPGRISRGQAFLPIDDKFIVRPGDRLEVTIKARPSDNFLAWIVRHERSGHSCSHSTWQSSLLSKADLERTRPEKLLRLSKSADARQIVTSFCNGRNTSNEITALVLKEHPDLFPSLDETKRFISEVIRKDCE